MLYKKIFDFQKKVKNQDKFYGKKVIKIAIEYFICYFNFYNSLLNVSFVRAVYYTINILHYMI